MVATLFQHSNTVLREKLSMRIVSFQTLPLEEITKSKGLSDFSQRERKLTVCQYEFDTIIQVIRGSRGC